MQQTWESYFKLVNTGSGPRYQYIDTSVIALPEGLPMPPTNHRISFNACHKLIDISALAKWDTSNVTTMSCMFNHCYELQDISPIAEWDTSNVTDMSHMFNCCYKLDDITSLYYWNIARVKNMWFIFNGCHSLHNEARFGVNNTGEFSQFMDHYITPKLYPVTYCEFEEEEEFIDDIPTIVIDAQEITIDSYEEESSDEYDLMMPIFFKR